MPARLVTDTCGRPYVGGSYIVLSDTVTGLEAGASLPAVAVSDLAGWVEPGIGNRRCSQGTGTYLGSDHLPVT